MADLLVLPRPAKSVQIGAGFSGKNLNILGLLKRKVWPQCHPESSGKYAGAARAKRKRNKAICPKHQIVRGEDQGEQEPYLGEREEDQSGSMKKKGWNPQ